MEIDEMIDFPLGFHKEKGLFSHIEMLTRMGKEKEVK